MGYSILFSITIKIAPTVHKGSLFSTSLPMFVISCLFDDGHSNSCEVISHCGLIFISLMINDFLSTYTCTYWQIIHLLRKNVCSGPFPIFNWIICFLAIQLYECLYILDINPLCGMWFTNIFSHSLGFLFSFLIIYFAVQAFSLI